jgi:acyl carrier protein
MLSAQLRSHLKRSLFDYMVPARLEFVDEIPRTERGKLDLQALPTPRRRKLRREAPHLPRNVAERVVAAIWRDVLRLHDVDIRDNFFDSGGHSLYATKLVWRLRSIFHVDLPLRAIFDAPTIEALTAKLADLGAQQGCDVNAIAAIYEKVSSMSQEETESQLRVTKGDLQARENAWTAG